VSYNAPEPIDLSPDPGPRGRVARYAWGRDYHAELGERLKAFCADVRLLGPPEARLKTFVDTGRIVDRAVAQRAGLGWYGKNSNILTHQLGSWVFLAEVLTNLPLPPDEPVRTHCGSCQACMPACPTKAIVAPGVIDNDRCISYLTIELRGPIPRDLRTLVGDWIFGCDICQEVCPVNRKAPTAAPPAFHADQGIGPRPELVALLDLDDESFRVQFGHTPLKRTGRRGLVRNVCVALGNTGDRSVVPALIRALGDAEPLVRGHAAWALGRLGGDLARAALLARRELDTDAWVAEEVGLALG
jgi:epoxyqueuosine reductase